MATPIAISLGSLNLGTAPYTVQEPMQWGSDAVHAALLTGDYRPEELDQAVQALGLVRQVSIPMSIRSSTADAAITDQQAITTLISQASRYVPLNLTVTPTNSTRVSTFKVWGGSWSADYTNYTSLSNVTDGTLLLQCDPFVYGAAQNLGSSGAPLGTANTPSPAAFTLTPNPVGDVPSNVTLFVKNRSASSIRSMLAASISGNTTWVMNKGFSTWTTGADGLNTGTYMTSNDLTDTTTILQVASFTTPTLPTDRLYRIMLRALEFTNTSQKPGSFRVRVVSGSTEVIGQWRTPPFLNNNPGLIVDFLADMGGFMIPVGEVGSLGAGTTTVFVEARGNDTTAVDVAFKDVFFLPEDSTIIVETSDTAKVLAAAAATVQLETDQVYTSAGNPAGGVTTGWQLRILGSTKVYVYTSQQYTGNMNTSPGYLPENVDVWATITPRYIGLA